MFVLLVMIFFCDEGGFKMRSDLSAMNHSSLTFIRSFLELGTIPG